MRLLFPHKASISPSYQGVFHCNKRDVEAVVWSGGTAAHTGVPGFESLLHSLACLAGLVYPRGQQQVAQVNWVPATQGEIGIMFPVPIYVLALGGFRV